VTLPSSALYTARPLLELDGSESVELTDRVLSLVVTETTEGMTRCDVVAGNWTGEAGSGGYMFNDRSIIDFGREIVIRLGDRDRSGMVFRGQVTGIEAHYPEARPPEIVFLAEDRLQDLRMTRRTRSFEDASDEDIIRTVVSAHGLTPSIDIDGPTHRHVAQTNQSDLAFIRDRARMVDADVWIAGDAVHVVARSRRSSADDITLTYNSDLHEVSILADLADQRSSFVVAGWDAASKEAIVATADIAAIESELAGDTSGIEFLEQAFQARTDTIVHSAPETTEEAQAQADMALRTSARRFVVATGRAEGDARLHVGSRVRLAHVGPSFTGTYTLVEVEHTFDTRLGYLTRFRAERPGLGGAS
jgi:Bacteriophage probable baseplate hub protein